ncbi:MAG: carboxymuconolactone decarboxylase family protein [Planctomycetota bacterium]
MPWIRQFADDDADTPADAQRELAAARQRAGRVWNIVRIMTPNPAVLRASMAMYQAIMHGPSPLSRRQRELLAVVVSKENGCVY